MAATIQQQLPSYVFAKEAEEEWKKHEEHNASSGASPSGQDSPWKTWDNRNSKPAERYLNSKHRGTQDPLWMDSRHTPPWPPEQRASPQLKSKIDHFVASLRTCIQKKDLVSGARIHDDLLRSGLLEKCSQTLVIMYAKCGNPAKAKELLDLHKSSSHVVTWTAVITAFAQEGLGRNALECLEQMQRDGFPPNAVTYASILKACGMIGVADKGRQIHSEIIRQGLPLENDVVLGGSLVDMYAKCGALSRAQQVLGGLPCRDVVSWNALIGGYVQGGHGDRAVECYEQMQLEGIFPDAVSYANALKACAGIGAIEKGKQIHENIAREGLLQDNIVLGGALVDMYAKCGAVSKARQVFDGLPARDAVSWSALIAGYAQGGHAEQAMNCFEEMQLSGIPPDNVTYTCILKACATIGAVDMGKRIHDEIDKLGLLWNNVMLGGALVDMYAKNGDVSKAREVLDGLHSRDVIAWTALIAGYAQEGYAEEALDSFEEMQREGVLPNAVTCTCVLNVCNHQGLVEEGETLFVDMSTKYGVIPSVDCYTCMVDLFGRSGHLEKAVRLIEGMPSSDYSIIWHTLLGSCRKWSDVSVGRWAFERAIDRDKCDGPAYTLMESIYAVAGMEQEAADIEAMRIRNRAWKQPGRSAWIDANNALHTFSAEDMKHAQRKSFYAKLDDIAHKISQWRYSTEISRNISHAAQAHLLCRHSEELALACALINTAHGKAIYITKDARMCGDCHVVTSLISKIEARTIFVADDRVRHCFKDGKCSCNDYLG